MIVLMIANVIEYSVCVNAFFIIVLRRIYP